MENLTFTKCLSSISDADLDNLETAIGAPLPKDFRSHYLLHNGGIPAPEWFPANDDWEPIWIHKFLAIATADDNPIPSIGTLYQSMTKKNVIQKSALPFALDPGSNFICLNLHDGTVFYHANDVFDPALTAEENQAKAQRSLAKSFSEFVELLTTEDEAYE